MNPSPSLVVIATLGTAAALAQAPFTGTGLTIDLDSTLPGVNEGPFTGAGFQPDPATGQLDSDAWAVVSSPGSQFDFGGDGTAAFFSQGTHAGGTGTGGFFAFQVGGAADVALGFQGTGTEMTPGSITLRIRNDTGGTLDQVTVGYEIQTRNDQSRANSLNFSYSTDGSGFTPVALLDYVSPEAPDTVPSWVRTDRETTLVNLAIAAGSHLELRWSSDDVGGSGARDELAIDDIRLAVPVPEPSHMALVMAAILGAGAVTRKRLRRPGHFPACGDRG